LTVYHYNLSQTCPCISTHRQDRRRTHTHDIPASIEIRPRQNLTVHQKRRKTPSRLMKPMRSIVNCSLDSLSDSRSWDAICTAWSCSLSAFLTASIAPSRWLFSLELSCAFSASTAWRSLDSGVPYEGEGPRRGASEHFEASLSRVSFSESRLFLLLPLKNILFTDFWMVLLWPSADLASGSQQDNEALRISKCGPQSACPSLSLNAGRVPFKSKRLIQTGCFAFFSVSDSSAPCAKPSTSTADPRRHETPNLDWYHY
jgi:hypothetical protein